MSPEIEKSVLKIDLSPLNWIQDAKTRLAVRKITQRVAGLKFKTYGLPSTISSKEDIRDILVSLGWSLRLELTLEEIEDIKTSVVVNTEHQLKIVDVCLVPHTNGRRHFICIRIRNSQTQADCTNTPIQLIKHQQPTIGKRKRAETTPGKKESFKKQQESATKKTRISI